MSEEIVYQVEDGIAIIRINRPGARNAMNWAAQEGFAAAVTAVSQNPAISALIITGTGDQAFVAGGDLKELSQNPDRTAGERLNQVMGQALAQLTELPIPVIAAINGDAFGGGCELLTACDLRLTVPQARFSFAQVKVGLTTGWGGTARLVNLIGQSRAAELLLTARTFDADEAYRLGLIHRILPPESNVLEATRAWAVELSQLSRPAVAAVKKLVYQPLQHSLREASTMETHLFLQLWGQPDHLEALNAFAEKRKPAFQQHASSNQ
jgi:enoyl-CoA hydratase